ncbi:hypothetical protein [Cupriavidus necator]|uniref:hypothetical protein n=1 Tax=Cupriavidus necator TaxID=106590 RepID=UPI00339D6E88
MATNGNKSDSGVSVVVRDAGATGRPVRQATVGLWKVSDDESDGAVRSMLDNPEALRAHPDQPADFFARWQARHRVAQAHTDRDGRARLPLKDIEPGYRYYAVYEHYPFAISQFDPEMDRALELLPSKGIVVQTNGTGDNGIPGVPRVGDRVELIAQTDLTVGPQWGITPPSGWHALPDSPQRWVANVTEPGPMTSRLQFWFAHMSGAAGQRRALVDDVQTFHVDEAPVQKISGTVKASLERTSSQFSEDTAFWTAILNCTEALSFNTYLKFMDYLFEGRDDSAGLDDFEQQRFSRATRDEYTALRKRRLLPFTDTDAYRLVKAATEAFVMVNSGVMRTDDHQAAFTGRPDLEYLERRGIPVPGRTLLSVFNKQYLEQGDGYTALPYLAIIRSKLPELSLRGLARGGTPQEGRSYALLQRKLDEPCLLELIWSYWHEEGMLAQSVKAVARRFQNVRSPGSPDPLANMEIDGLRPLAPVLFGYIQDEQHRLTVVRRNYEYDHQYGLRLQGKAVQDMRPADTRSKFIEAFHNLLRLCTAFYRQDDDTTVKADAFPVLNALKEVHLILSQGAHNQFGDLTSTARIEMMMEQWLLARPEFREFLPSRVMVAYPEPWMDRVDAMKKLQGWSDTSVLHFRNLGAFGEQILLSVRYGAWSVVYEPLQAFNWARFWRPQVQGYVHAYRAATGVDLTTEQADTQVEATMPSVLLQKRLAQQQRTA